MALGQPSPQPGRPAADFGDFADVRLIDSHIHFPHPGLTDDLLSVLDLLGIEQANLVAVLDLQEVNQNPALIEFKSRYPGRAYISGALDYRPTLGGGDGAASDLGSQVRTMRAMGFDGLKLVEGKPMVRRLLGLPFDGPAYGPMWEVLEELEFPIVFHVADPEEFWDPDGCPDWARDHGWFYGTEDFPAKEELYGEITAILARHPRLRVVLAHFYFMSGNLERAGAFLDAHPSVCFDLTPGIEMYINFARRIEATRDFFLAYADRVIYGTDIGASAIVSGPNRGIDPVESACRAWIVRQFLEAEGPFAAPEGVGHALGMDVQDLCGIALPQPVLERVYRTNFERVFGRHPRSLDRHAALEAMEVRAAEIDEAAGEPVESGARLAARSLREQAAGSQQVE